MAERLFSVRRDFVNNVRLPGFKQLLDDLLLDQILNDQEKDSILESNSTTADKARDLIDLVRHKGDAASKKMIDHIEEIDKNLYNQLFPQKAYSSQGAEAAPTPHVEFSDKLIPSTEAFWNKQQMDKDVYPALQNAIKKRVALLITNIKFREEKHNRRGADQDHKNMEAMLSALGYEVVKHTNLTAQEIDEALINFSKHPKLKDTDSVIVVIMSHGKLGFVLGVNYREDVCANETPDEFPIDNICKHLRCLELENKPKVVIIQACRGEKTGSLPVWNNKILHSDSPVSAAREDFEDDSLRFVIGEKDFIFLLSSTPHMKAYRHPVDGSVLIQYVVEVFNTFAHELHIEDLFRKVCRRFEDFQCGDKRQMATRDRCTLTRRFYLFPGI